jgi:hypothetical protein
MSDLELLIALIAEAEKDSEGVWRRICRRCLELYAESKRFVPDKALTIEIVEERTA